MSRLKDNQALESMGLNSVEQIEFYRILVNSIQDYAIFLMDPNGYIASWNVGAQKLKGYAPHEIIGRHFSSFYSQEDRDNDKPGYELVVCNRDGRVEDEGWRIKKDGSRFWANVVITALYDRSGTRIGYAKVTRDLTERKKHEDSLQEANRVLERQRAELEKLNISKDEFISLASHQLRTPATGVRQFLGLLMDGYAGKLTPQQHDFVKRADESNTRQIDLVNNLLKVAQVDAGKILLKKATANVCALIQDVINEQVDSFKDRGQKLTLNLPVAPINASLDILRFRMALENIVDNASKYTHHGGKITITASEAHDAVLISIKDSGVGIDADSLAKLFSKFSRIQNELSDTVGGSGLGLYWAERIIDLHGGKITVTSVKGIGSTFDIHLPKDAI